MSILSRNRNPQRDRSTQSALEKSVNDVEYILSSINVNPAEARVTVEAGYGWSFQRGSALIEVYVSQEDRGYLQVLSPIMHLPYNNLLALYRKLLELNLKLTNAAVGVFEDVIYVYNERPLEGLDHIEAESIIRKVAIYAEELDQTLIQEFGGRLYNQPN